MQHPGHRPRRRLARAVATGAALALLVAGCGSDDTSSGDGPSKDATACRGEWKDLGKQVQGNDSKTNPSALSARWNNVVATIDYYVDSAKKTDCGDAISKQKDAIAALGEFGKKLAPYDMELRLETVRDDAEAYATAPRPPATTPSPAPKTKKNKHPKQPKPIQAPAPSSIGEALKTLTAQAPLATEQQGPGWEQARVVELTDAPAVAKSVKDLAFLSTESAAYRACVAALAQIRVALAVKQ
jgi:hypothetical protein